ncbi:hypothetical protein GCM10008967_16230 [Bacillus carboniphilus]|uniref:Uncharacterized protein n=1 Tax=Bacillus carboniphilus TaxID=86663 RepID=A0ABP3FWI3_9BACI
MTIVALAATRKFANHMMMRFRFSLEMVNTFFIYFVTLNKSIKHIDLFEKILVTRNIRK